MWGGQHARYVYTAMNKTSVRTDECHPDHECGPQKNAQSREAKPGSKIYSVARHGQKIYRSKAACR